MVDNRIACFLTCGYSESGSMQSFLRKINAQFEYKQYLPNKTIKRKGDPKTIRADINGLTGEKLLEKVYEILNKYRNDVNQCRAVLIEDDLDGRFHNKTQADVEAYMTSIVGRVRDILQNQDMPVFLLFASPEVETWFIADWNNGFKKLYEEMVPSDLTVSERQFFVHHLKQFIDKNVLMDYMNQIENYGYFPDGYHKLSDELINAVLTGVKDQIRKSGTDTDLINKIVSSRHLYYSKQQHGHAMLTTIDPSSVGQQCTIFFNPVYLSLTQFK